MFVSCLRNLWRPSNYEPPLRSAISWLPARTRGMPKKVPPGCDRSPPSPARMERRPEARRFPAPPVARHRREPDAARRWPSAGKRRATRRAAPVIAFSRASSTFTARPAPAARIRAGGRDSASSSTEKSPGPRSVQVHALSRSNSATPATEASASCSATGTPFGFTGFRIRAPWWNPSRAPRILR